MKMATIILAFLDEDNVSMDHESSLMVQSTQAWTIHAFERLPNGVFAASPGTFQSRLHVSRAARLDNRNNEPIDSSLFLKGRTLTIELTGEDSCLSRLQELATR
jgi:hypothetical protein